MAKAAAMAQAHANAAPQAVTQGRVSASESEREPTRSPAQVDRWLAFLGGRSLQAKLNIGAVDDPLEREADAAADQVMRGDRLVIPISRSPAVLGRKCAECDKDDKEEPLQRKGSCDSLAGTTAPPIIGRVLASAGRPLDAGTHRFMGDRFGADFGGVRIHTGSEAAASANAVNARAYTVGQHIVFGAGRYDPASRDGVRLLAHELAHTLQQGKAVSPNANKSTTKSPSIGGLSYANGPSLQRAPDCNLDHIVKECDGAAKSCQSVDSYCKKNYPTAADIQTLHANGLAGAESKKKTIPNAADNLLHFFGGTGAEKVMPTAIFKDHDATKNQLKDVHREKFKEGAKKRLDDGRLVAGGTGDMVWTDTANAFDLTESDLGLAVGGYTLCSKVTVSAKSKGGSNIEVNFTSWTVQAFDCYNWDPGKLIGGLFGGISDKDLCCLENAGKAKHFRIRTDPWNNAHAAGSFTISSGAAPPKTKPPPTPPKDDDR